MAAKADMGHHHEHMQASDKAQGNGKCLDHRACTMCHSGSLPQSLALGLFVPVPEQIFGSPEKTFISIVIAAEIRPPIAA